MRFSTRSLLALGTAALAAATASADSPAWWTERGVTKPDSVPNDYAAANIGQVKNVAKQAVAAMNARFPGGGGTELIALIDSWAPGVGSGTRNDYGAVNQGQLKAIAKAFYKRLAAVGYSGPPLVGGQKFPWTEATTDDASYAPANIGQVKRVFSFFLDDTDLDGVADSWERKFFGTLSRNGSGDNDGDGLPDAWEFQHGLNPTVNDAANDTDGDSVSNLDEYRRGTDPRRISGDPLLIVFTPTN